MTTCKWLIKTGICLTYSSARKNVVGILISACNFLYSRVQDDSKSLSGFPFIGYGIPDNNLESLCVKILQILLCFEVLAMVAVGMYAVFIVRSYGISGGFLLDDTRLYPKR
jgi:hypothetical protein